MFDSVFTRRVQPLNQQQIAMLRIWLHMPSLVPAPPYKGALPLSTEQGHLLLSLPYGAGVSVSELSQMELDALLHEDGTPRDHVHIRAATTKHRVARRTKMHPDIRRDAVAFRDKHPGQRFVAFVPLLGGHVHPAPMSAHALSTWFAALFGNAGLRGLTGQSGRKFFNDNQRSN